jgi:hypothetical protein
MDPSQLGGAEDPPAILLELAKLLQGGSKLVGGNSHRTPPQVSAVVRSQVYSVVLTQVVGVVRSQVHPLACLRRGIDRTLADSWKAKPSIFSLLVVCRKLSYEFTATRLATRSLTSDRAGSAGLSNQDSLY